MRIKLHWQQILDLASNSESYRRGEAYFNEGRITTIHFLTAQSGTTTVIADVQGQYKTFRVYVIADYTGRIKQYECNCDENKIWRGACKHIVAVLFAAMNGNNITTKNALMQKTAKNLVHTFEIQQLHEIDFDFKPNLELTDSMAVTPTVFFVNQTMARINFTVGARHKYVVKNIKEFITAIRNEASVSYGKKLSFTHRLSAFDETSQQLIRLIERQLFVSFELYQHDPRFGYEPSYAGRELPILRHTFDDLFSLYLGQELNFGVSHDVVHSLTLFDTPPDLLLVLKTEDNKIKITCDNTQFEVFEGAVYTYLYTTTAIHRITKKYANAVLPFLQAYKKSELDYLEFEGEDKQTFVAIVLPVLQTLDLLSAESEIPEATQDILTQKNIYLDSVGSKVKATIMFSYATQDVNILTPDSSTSGISRNAIEEYKLKRLMESLGFEQNETDYWITDDDKIYDLYLSGIQLLMNHAQVLTTADFSKKSMPSGSSKSSFGIRLTGNLLELQIDTGDYSVSDLLEAITSYTSKKRYHRLKSGRFINLENDSIRSSLEVLSSFDLNKKDIHKNTIVLPKYRALYLDSILKANDNLAAATDENFQTLTSNLLQSGDNENKLSFPIPPSLEPILRPYQKIGYNWLKTLTYYGFGGILADDMGLGKTLQVIALLLSEKLANNPSPSIVIAPTSLLYNWEREIHRFASDLNVLVLSGNSTRRKALLSQETDIDVYITTYDILKRDLENFAETEFQYVIADEAQYIKNPNTQNASSVKELRGKSKFALTGTPIENSLSELWSIFDFIMPGYLYNATKFSRQFETPIIKNEDKEKSAKLQKYISPFILRRLKADVLTELPDKVETTLYAEMDFEQKRLYTAKLLEARGELTTLQETNAVARHQIDILAQLTRLRQICCHPALLVNKYKGGSCKLDLALEVIRQATNSGHRILLFSQFTAMLALLVKELEANKITYFYLDGQTPSLTRTQMVDKFNEGERSIFLISLKAGGTGLNLTGADTVIHYDQWWNPAVMNQASDRAHRFGQKKVVQVIHLITRDTIEEKIQELQARKKDLVDSVIREGASFISAMSAEEIESLFAE